MKRLSLSVKLHYLIAGIITDYNAAGDYTATLVSATGCDSIATLHLIINPVVTGEETITICEAALPYSWNVQTITAAGDYTANLGFCYWL